ncbi:MAG: hypothetical protein K2H45_02880, partial [Acetatifactor sp.]|nr:hypothetical protein [Acetatifactor sp.]
SVISFWELVRVPSISSTNTFFCIIFPVSMAINRHQRQRGKPAAADPIVVLTYYLPEIPFRSF